DLIQHALLAGALVVVPVRRESDPAAGHGHGLAHDQQLGDVVVVLAGLAEDEAVLPLVDVLAGFSLLDIFRRAEIGGIALLTIGGENSRLHALLAVQLHCGFGRHIQGGGQIVIDIA
ncbi:Lineage-specific thermal regulator protein, partial [Dysosmobacter welbionis]